MKILVLNGSPRMNGNTKIALNAIIGGIRKNRQGDSVEFIDVAKCRLSGCVNCNACQENGGKCVTPDDSAALMEKVSKADFLLIGSPVYWWGISSQLKMVIDKFYSRGEEFHRQKKVVGLLAVGEADLSECQYRLIREQFESICGYLGWKLAFYAPASACAAGELEKNAEYMASCAELWKKI